MPNTQLSPSTLAERLFDGDGGPDAADAVGEAGEAGGEGVDAESAPYVLDVRMADEYEEWSIPGSQNLPIYDQLLDGQFTGLRAALDDLPRDREIAVVCVAGVTSASAAEYLREAGFDATSVDDGMNGWGRVHRVVDLDGGSGTDADGHGGSDGGDGYGGVHAEGVVQVVRPGTGCLSSLVHDGAAALVVDPSQYVEEYLAAADERDLTVTGVLDTHAHADHVSGARRLAGELDVPYYLHPADRGELAGTTDLSDGESIAVGDRSVEVRHTPGHTGGSVTLATDDALLTGDTLFLESVGRPDLEDGSGAAVRAASENLYDSVRVLLSAGPETAVLPGHVSRVERVPLGTTLGELTPGPADVGAAVEAADAAVADGGEGGGSTNELLARVVAGDREGFVDAIVESLSETPANYRQIKEINQGRVQPGGDVESIELGPNNCAAN